MDQPVTSKMMADELIISAPSIVWQTRWKLSSNCPSDILKCVQNRPWFSVSSSVRGGEESCLCCSALVTVIQLYFKHIPPPQSTYIYLYFISSWNSRLNEGLFCFFLSGECLVSSCFSKRFLVCLARRSEFLYHLSLWSPTSRRIFPCVNRLCERSPALGARLALVHIISRSSLFNHCGQDFLWSPRFPLLPALLYAATF